MTANRTRAACAAMAAAMVFFAGCTKPPEKTDTIRPARVMTVRAATGEDVMLFAGEVRPRYEIDLSFRIGGKLLERKVDMGAQVKRGQPLALSGMIMRNSVILIDQIEQDIAAGHPAWNAIIDSTVRRFRPIVLTALAAIFAMIPLTRSVFFGPMAVAIMGGLFVATVLTLLFLPAFYAAWFRVRKTEAAAT